MMDGAPPALVELALYVNPSSVGSLRIRSQIEAALAQFDAAQIRFEVLDITTAADRAEEDRVLFVPTLVKRQPDPPTWLVGDAGGQYLETLLASCGVERAR